MESNLQIEKPGDSIIRSSDTVLVTGATGFIGPAVVASLLRHGFGRIRAFVRHSSDLSRLQALAKSHTGAEIEMCRGNLLSKADCERAVEGVAVVYHLATISDKSFANAFMNSVVTTRNLTDACRVNSKFRRFVNVSSFAVYPNRSRGGFLDETSEVDGEPHKSGDAYCFAKVKQDEFVIEDGKRGLPYVIVRPGSVFGPGKKSITGRVGIDTFGIFLHMGGGNKIPFTYVDNCADAIVLAGIRPGVEGEIFNVVDDDLPSSRKFLRLYKKHIQNFRSLYVPQPMSFLFCLAWERYAAWSEGQLPNAFNRRRWHAEWKSTRYSNAKLKAKLGWRPRVPMDEALNRFFKAYQQEKHA
jgi:nucleoside-diphosphate-sugar epimerase